jgi:putative oxidoreductase
MFPNGWPGCGLLLLRASAGVLVIHQTLSQYGGSTQPSFIGLAASALAALLLLLGIWTPAAGLLLAVLEVVRLYNRTEQIEVGVLMTAVALSIAMLGPGVWSIDAALYGRHRLELPED